MARLRQERSGKQHLSGDKYMDGNKMSYKQKTALKVLSSRVRRESSIGLLLFRPLYIHRHKQEIPYVKYLLHITQGTTFYASLNSLFPSLSLLLYSFSCLLFLFNCSSIL